MRKLHSRRAMLSKAWVPPLTLWSLFSACGPPPPEPPRNRPAVQLRSGRATSCAVLDTGLVRCWGSDLADPGLPLSERGLPIDRCMDEAERPRFDTTPRDVPDLKDAVEVSVGGRFACAVTRAGGARCWGSNYRGELGDGSEGTFARVPTRVQGLSNVAQISAGLMHACARLNDGSVRCWGKNDFGQLGDGLGATRTTPSTVAGLSDALQISAGMFHTCAQRENGAVACWGAGPSGELGTGDDQQRITPVQVSGLTDVVEIQAGSGLTCARTRDGSVKCWGSFQSNDGIDKAVFEPTEVARRADLVAMRVGWSTLCLVRASGEVECFGGIGTEPQGRIALESPSSLMPLTGVVDLAIGQQSLCALGAEGRVECLGQNLCGQLGDGTVTNRRTIAAPVAL